MLYMQTVYLYWEDTTDTASEVFTFGDHVTCFLLSSLTEYAYGICLVAPSNDSVISWQSTLQ
jgi:hypothetical protein